MLATGSRPQKLINSSLFGMATRVLVQSLLSEIDINLELDMMLFWTQAVAQHYGPGSSYLDVTYSLDVALWFALHEYKPVGVTLVFGEGDQPDPANDIYRKEHWVTYPDWTKTAYLYVFDAPKWKPGLGSTHGQLIDLADAPPIFSSSARMRAQSGCLLDSGLDRAQADLSDCFKVAPIPIAWPMTGAPKLNWTSEDLFPGPEIDEWYKRFLAIPLVPQPDRSIPPQITVAHPVPVTVYMPREKERALAVMNCEVGIAPALMYSTLGDPTLEPYDPVSQKSVKLALSDATVIVVESSGIRISSQSGGISVPAKCLRGIQPAGHTLGRNCRRVGTRGANIARSMAGAQRLRIERQPFLSELPWRPDHAGYARSIRPGLFDQHDSI
jgi:hypothetical protein